MQKKSCVQIQRFIDWLKEQGKSVYTLKNYQRTMQEFNDWLQSNNGRKDTSFDLDEITRFDIQQFINHLQAKGNSNSTVNNKYACLSSYARFIKRLDVLEDIRVPQVRSVKNVAPRCLERKERNRLLREVERKGNRRDIAMTYFLLHTGLRVGELVSLNQDDITMNERSGSVLVRNGKGSIERKVPLSKEVRLHLQRYLTEREDQLERKGTSVQPLFFSNYKKRISVRTVQYVLKQFGISPHELRHTFARELVSNGVDISTVADLCGHADINVTRRYSKPTEAQLSDAIDKVFS